MSARTNYRELVTTARACLVDVYETLLTNDFAGRYGELPALAGVPVPDWNRERDRIVPELTDGRISLTQAFERILRACGVPPRPELLRELVSKDRERLLATARLYDDSIPFLTGLRSRGIAIALVSNCSEHTRDLLDGLGLPALVDAVVLSFEVGYAKPAAEIYELALDEVGVPAGDAVFVDDQPAYCAGAEALGIRAVQIARNDGVTRARGPAADWAIVGSLSEAGSML